MLSWFSWGYYGIAAEMGVIQPVISPAAWAIQASPGQRPVFLGLVGFMIGALVFGDIGDRVSRRASLIGTLGLVGIVSLGIGCFVPHYGPGPMGWMALRFTQGVAVGGQWASAVLLPLEQCSSDASRALAGAVVQSASAIGMALAALANVLPVRGIIGRDLAWRLSFGATALMTIPLLALCIFHCPRGDGSPQPRQPGSSPSSLRQIVFDYPHTILIGMAMSAVNVWGLSVMLSGWGALLPVRTDGGLVLLALALAMATVALCTFVAGGLGDRAMDSRKLYFVGALWTGVASVAWVLLLGPNRDVWPMLTVYLLTLGPAVGLLQGLIPVLLADRFHGSIRCTGMGLVVNGCHLLIQGSFPSITRALVTLPDPAAASAHLQAFARTYDGANVMYLALFVAAVATVGAVTVARTERYLSTPLCGRGPLVRRSVLPIAWGEEVHDEPPLPPHMALRGTSYARTWIADSLVEEEGGESDESTCEE